MNETLIKTTYTEENRLKFFRFNIFTRNRGVVIGFTALYAVLLIYNIVRIIMNLSAGKSLGMAEIISLVIILFCAYWIYSRFFTMPKKMAKRDMDKPMIVSEVTLSEDCIHVDVKSGSSASEDSKDFPYAELNKVYETKDFFYVFVTKSYAYMLDKSGIEKGSVEDAENIFSEKLTKKQFKGGKLPIVKNSK